MWAFSFALVYDSINTDCIRDALDYVASKLIPFTIS